MTSGPDDTPNQHEPTFADVMNGFGLYSERSRKRRRWGRGREDDAAASAGGQPPADADQQWPAWTPDAGHPEPPVADPVEQPGIPVLPPAFDEQYPTSSGVSAVRPYAWTRGRTRSGFDLAIETLVSTSPQGRGELALLQLEHRSVAELCEEPRSVAEIAALLKLPLGVVRVLLGDMAGLGVVTVHQNSSGSGSVPDLALMERVLSGLRRL